MNFFKKYFSLNSKTYLKETVNIVQVEVIMKIIYGKFEAGIQLWRISSNWTGGKAIRLAEFYDQMRKAAEDVGGKAGSNRDSFPSCLHGHSSNILITLLFSNIASFKNPKCKFIQVNKQRNNLRCGEELEHVE